MEQSIFIVTTLAFTATKLYLNVHYVGSTTNRRTSCPSTHTGAFDLLQIAGWEVIQTERRVWIASSIACEISSIVKTNIFSSTKHVHRPKALPTRQTHTTCVLNRAYLALCAKGCAPIHQRLLLDRRRLLLCLVETGGPLGVGPAGNVLCGADDSNFAEEALAGS